MTARTEPTSTQSVQDREWVERDRAIYLSVSRALWGEVFPTLSRVEFQADDTSIDLLFVVSEPMNENDADSTSSVGGEVMGDYPDLRVNEIVVVEDVPTHRPGYRTVFARRLDPK